MRKIISWLTLIPFVARFVFSRIGIGTAPHLDDYIDACTDIVDTFVGLHRRTRIVHPERVPGDGPLIVAANHFKLDDPCVLYHTTRMATGKARRPRIMMRDDFFTGRFFESNLFNSVEFFRCLGAYPISRDQVTLGQMKPFLEVLEQDMAFLIFPGRTRSRSGLLIEYRDNFTEPGGVSFFVRQAQRRRPGVRVPTVPAARSYNPVTRQTAVVYGNPIYLEPGADKAAAREFDFRLIEAIAGLFEVTMAHVVAAVIGMRAIEGKNEGMTVNRIEDIVRAVFASAQHPYFEPLPAESAMRPAVVAALRYFERYGMLALDANVVSIDLEAVRYEPELDSDYREKNPVKFLCNQILHLDTVLHAVEQSLGTTELTAMA